jgi:hypothetical protein
VRVFVSIQRILVGEKGRGGECLEMEEASGAGRALEEPSSNGIANTRMVLVDSGRGVQGWKRGLGLEEPWKSRPRMGSRIRE